MKYTRGRNQGRTRKTAIRRKREDKEDVAEIEKRLKEPGPIIPFGESEDLAIGERDARARTDR
jgi:hypothetical protein